MRRYYFPVLFLVTLSIHVYVSTIGWNNSLSDLHGFRQTQTAITTYFFVKEGFHPDYPLPVFGAPWAIPFEFPLYQGIVAAVVRVSGLPLEQTGRAVSIVFFYLCVALVYRLLKQFGFKTDDRFLFLSLILACPLYLFWSRTFMIESFSLFLALLFFSLVVSLGQKPGSMRLLALASLVGCVAILVKLTTFVVFLFPAFVSFCYFYFKEKRNRILLKILVWVFIDCLLLFALPLFLASLWTRYTDAVKGANPLASHVVTSDALHFWLFGNWSERIDSNMWRWILGYIERGLLGSHWLWVGIIALLLIFRRHRWMTILSLVSFFLGILIFTNLYFVHEYYLYANGLFLLIALGNIFLALLSLPRFQAVTKFVLFPGFIIFLFSSYIKWYYPVQSTNSYGLVELGRVINFFTSDTDVVLLNQYDYDPEIAYYARRKAIVDWWRMSLSDSRFQKSLSLTGKERITAMYMRNEDRDLIPERIAYFGFSPKPVYSNQSGSLYVKQMEGSHLSDKIKQMEKAVLYDGIANYAPERLTSTNVVERRFVGDKNVLLVHAPGEVVFTLPENASALTAEYGIMPQALDQDKKHTSDGVIFTIDLLKNGMTQTVFRRHLMPWKNWEERAMQMVKLPIPKDCRDCQLSFKTLPGANPFWDWSYWRGIQIQ